MFKDVPEFPPRYQNRFGSSVDIRKLKVNAEEFRTESRDFIRTVKNQSPNESGLPKYFTESPIRAAAASMMGNINRGRSPLIKETD